MIELKTPLRDVRQLKAGDDVSITGTIYTARDRAHRYLLEINDFEENLHGAVIYHCGPIVRKNRVISAGPTTSNRMSMYAPGIIKKYGVKAFIGKGGMDMKETKAVYLSAVGGAGALLAKRAVKIENVFMLEEFGETEAIWKLKVKGFPAIVTVDSSGRSLHDEILRKSREKLINILND
jgi:fumarate hydratase subunit beta